MCTDGNIFRFWFLSASVSVTYLYLHSLCPAHPVRVRSWDIWDFIGRMTRQHNNNGHVTPGRVRGMTLLVITCNLSSYFQDISQDNKSTYDTFFSLKD